MEIGQRVGGGGGGRGQTRRPHHVGQFGHQRQVHSSSLRTRVHVLRRPRFQRHGHVVVERRGERSQSPPSTWFPTHVVPLDLGLVLCGVFHFGSVDGRGFRTRGFGGTNVVDWGQH